MRDEFPEEAQVFSIKAALLETLTLSLLSPSTATTSVDAWRWSFENSSQQFEWKTLPINCEMRSEFLFAFQLVTTAMYMQWNALRQWKINNTSVHPINEHLINPCLYLRNCFACELNFHKSQDYQISPLEIWFEVINQRKLLSSKHS